MHEGPQETWWVVEGHTVVHSPQPMGLGVVLFFKHAYSILVAAG